MDAARAIEERGTAPPGVRDGLTEARARVAARGARGAGARPASALSSTHAEHFSRPRAPARPRRGSPRSRAARRPPSARRSRRSLAGSRSAGSSPPTCSSCCASHWSRDRGRRGVPATDARPRVPARRAVRERGTTRRGRMPQHPPSSCSSSVSPGRACPGTGRSPSGRSAGRVRCPCRRRGPGRARSRGRRSAGSGARSARP